MANENKETTEAPEKKTITLNDLIDIRYKQLPRELIDYINSKGGIKNLHAQGFNYIRAKFGVEVLPVLIQYANKHPNS